MKTSTAVNCALNTGIFPFPLSSRSSGAACTCKFIAFVLHNISECNQSAYTYTAANITMVIYYYTALEERALRWKCNVAGLYINNYNNIHIIINYNALAKRALGWKIENKRLSHNILL